jgi:GT2 family glycosyltransferase
VNTIQPPSAPDARAISLCIINHNGAHHLEHSLAAARCSSLQFQEIILIDNASTDSSLELVRRCYPEVEILQLERNEGPAAARNAGFRRARNDLILFLDNDVALGPRCGFELRRSLEERAGVLAAMPRVLYADRKDTIQYEGADCHFLGHMAPRRSEAPLPAAPEDPVEVNSLITACFLFDRSVWGEEPPFDPTFVFNYEDHDLGIRSRVMGHRLLAVPSAVCLHGTGTPGLSYRPGGRQSELRVYCLMRNRWRIILQCFAGRTLLLAMPMFLLFEIFQLLGCARKGWLGVWCRAAGWMISHPGVTATGRRRIQAARRTADRMILQGGDIPFSRGLAEGWLQRAACSGLNRVSGSYWKLIEHRL